MCLSFINTKELVRMKRNAWSVSLVLALLVSGLASFGCQQAAPPTNREATATNANAAKEKVDPTAISSELTKLEQVWSDSATTHDVSAVSKVLADDVIITYPDGTIGTKADELRVIASGAITATSWEMLEPKVTVFNADVAFITGRTVVKDGKYKVENRKPIDISGEYRFTDVYARRNGEWQAVASQTTKIANPTPSPSTPPPAPKPSATSATSPASQTP
jgi:ketosteroid isomerase-like protein